MTPKSFVLHLNRFTEISNNVKVRVGKRWLYIDVDDQLRIIVDGFKNVEIIDETNLVKSK